MKTCSKCDQTKPLSAFHKQAGGAMGVKAWCADCANAVRKAYIKRKTAENAVADVYTAAAPCRVCSECKEEKTKDQFGVNRANPGGLNYRCKSCMSMRGKAWQARNPEYAATSTKAWKQANPERVAAYEEANAGRINERLARRRATKLLATPAWGSKEAIRAIYEFAEEFRVSGIDVHVDHIVPLRGKSVCGLHVEHNLRVCLAKPNMQKGNRNWEQFI